MRETLGERKSRDNKRFLLSGDSAIREERKRHAIKRDAVESIAGNDLRCLDPSRVAAVYLADISRRD